MDSQQLYMMQQAAARYPKPSRDRQLTSLIFSAIHVLLAVISLSQNSWSSLDSQHNKYYGLFNVADSDKPIAGSIAFFVLLGIVCSIAAAIFSLGYPRRWGACFRHNSVCNVVAVMTTVMACSFWYWFLHTLSANVTFGYCFYLMVAAGTSSVVAAGFNLFLSKPAKNRAQRPVTARYGPLSISAEDSGELHSPPAYSP